MQMRILRQVLMLQDMKTENSFIILIVVLLMYGTIMKL